MRSPAPWCAIGLLILAAGVLRAQDAAPPVGSLIKRITPIASSTSTRDSGVLPVQVPAPPAPPPAPAPAEPNAAAPPAAADAFAQAPASGGEAPAGLNPRMIGDLPGFFSLRNILLPSTQTIATFQNVTTLQMVTTFTPVPQIVVGQDGVRRVVVVQVPVVTQVPVTTRVPITFQQQTVVNTVTRVPVAGIGAVKIAENQSPMPEDRVFLSYNYYNDLRGPSGNFATPTVTTQQTTLNGFPASVSTVIPGAGPPSLNLQRGVFGFEKTFLDGNASLGLRVPLFMQQGDGTFNQRDIGDLSAIANFALYRDRVTGNVISAGLMVTMPTGPSVDTVAGNIDPTILQPFVGYRWYLDRWYFQGFTSLAVPTDGRVVTALFNDVGVGYWLYRGGRDQLISAIIPTVEAHLTTPLNHRGMSAADPLTVPDILALTAGVHIGLTTRSMLTIGTAVPVTGPRLFPIEAVAQFNFWF